jgi:hypothetical protein
MNLQVGDESYESYMAEKDGILQSLARRAKVFFFIFLLEQIFWGLITT